MATVNPVPAGLRTLTPHLTIDGAAEAIELYKKAFGAEEKSRALHPENKKVWHAELAIGDSCFFVNDVFAEMGKAHPTDLVIYVDKADELFARASKLGFEVVMPIADQFWGDRQGALKDKWGNKWTIGRHIKDMSPEEMTRAGEDFVKNSARPH